MKKILLTLVLVSVMFGTTAYAESNGYGFMKSEMSDLVEKVLKLEKQGLAKDEIVNQLMGSTSEVKTDITDTKVTPLATSTTNFGQLKKALRRGDNDESVKKLQEELNKLAKSYGFTFGVLTTDGKFGPATANAVRLFQTYRGITSDGVFGSKTLEHLKKFVSEHDDIDDDSEDDDLKDGIDDNLDDDEGDDEGEDKDEDDSE